MTDNLDQVPAGAKPISKSERAKVDFSDRDIRITFKGEELFALASSHAYGRNALSKQGRKALDNAFAKIREAMEKEAAI